MVIGDTPDRAFTPLSHENLSGLKKIPRPEIALEINLAWAASTPARL